MLQRLIDAAHFTELQVANVKGMLPDDRELIAKVISAVMNGSMRRPARDVYPHEIFPVRPLPTTERRKAMELRAAEVLVPPKPINPNRPNELTWRT